MSARDGESRFHEARPRRARCSCPVLNARPGGRPEEGGRQQLTQVSNLDRVRQHGQERLNTGCDGLGQELRIATVWTAKSTGARAGSAGRMLSSDRWSNAVCWRGGGTRCPSGAGRGSAASDAGNCSKAGAGPSST